MANYVKFVRGTPDAWKNYPIESRTEDTLFFISEPDEDYGELYIGNKIITSSIAAGDIIAKLSDLTDVNVSGIVDGQVLGWSASEEKWIPVTIEAAAQVDVMVGASDIEAGKAGLVPTPAAGDNNKFLRGDGKWITIPELSGLHIKKVDSIDAIDVEAADADNYIYLVKSETNDEYNEYLVIDKQIELIGTLEVSMDGYVTDAELLEVNNKISNLETSLGQVDTRINDITLQLNDYTPITDYNEKMTQIDEDIAKLKNSTTWTSL